MADIPARTGNAGVTTGADLAAVVRSIVGLLNVAMREIDLEPPSRRTGRSARAWTPPALINRSGGVTDTAAGLPARRRGLDPAGRGVMWRNMTPAPSGRRDNGLKGPGTVPAGAAPSHQSSKRPSARSAGYANAAARCIYARRQSSRLEMEYMWPNAKSGPCAPGGICDGESLARRSPIM